MLLMLFDNNKLIQGARPSGTIETESIISKSSVKVNSSDRRLRRLNKTWTKKDACPVHRGMPEIGYLEVI